LSYFIRELFYSIQGEGYHSGRPAVFCRFAGCNLWSGKESDREKAVCGFCDTDFAGFDGPQGGLFQTPEALSGKIEELWPGENIKSARPLVVCTGGEPLLQLDAELVSALHKKGFEVAVETNGTILPPQGIDWICVSPKAKAQLLLRSGQELKLVFPQPGAEPEKYAMLDFLYFFLQPMDSSDSPDREKNTRMALEYILSHPQWRLSLQMHKILGIK
jgi:7-carboxy-7-deazaguanine synthase (Cx14CxxC type)